MSGATRPLDDLAIAFDAEVQAAEDRFLRGLRIVAPASMRDDDLLALMREAQEPRARDES